MLRSSSSVVFTAVVASLLLARPVSADAERDNCKAQWGRDLEMVRYCVSKQDDARKALEKLWRRVGGRIESKSVWRICKERYPGAVRGYDWEMVLVCVNGDLGPARLTRESLQREGWKPIRHLTPEGIWYILGPVFYGPRGELCELVDGELSCR